MNTQLALKGAAALIVLLGLSGCGMAAAPENSPAAMAPMSTEMPMDGMSEAGNGMASMIHIEAGAYRDATPVAAGSTVTVMNMDTANYTLTSEDGSSFSVAVAAGAMATFKAPSKPGSYPFHSESNTSMHGVLTVR
ncbi:cupredoxin domain-containing protein [Arthrobacter sp. lap29]|uniref:cupredoxin domain-containing protein n=1 Tax=Arthrobacter sp. lap29 TaxID=3056122 RepID=UPI0028F6CC43|nr:cupredoxin domain-containing protein [Arthrobacter sp. lap29]